MTVLLAIRILRQPAAPPLGDLLVPMLAPAPFVHFVPPYRADRSLLQPYLMAAEAGNPMALHRIGDAYLAGQGVPLDPETGFLWYLRAANYGLGTAMLRIAVLYLDGVGVAPDISESYRWAWTVNAAARVDAQINRDYVGMSQQTVDASYRRMADPIYDLLTEQDKEAAQERARAWKPTPYPPLD